MRRERRTTCPCGQPKRSAGQGYCRGCHARWMRERRPRHRDLPPEQRRRANARSYANVYQRRGRLVPKPCSRCGASDVVKHHADYARPLDVTWLCRPCHRRAHRAAAAPC